MPSPLWGGGPPSPASCRPHAGMRKQTLVQMDGLVRLNAGASLDETVTLQHTPLGRARALTLSQVGAPGRPQGARSVLRHLDGIPFVVGDRIRAGVAGGQMREFIVESADPAGPVAVGPDTSIGFVDGATRSSAITYEDVGGLRQEVRRIREMIELPLKHPEVFQHLGIDPPKGVLLCGPPGTGKTLIARAVAQEANVHFIHLNGPEIIDKMYGASEAQLRRMFDEAQKQAPSIIFIDELDAIAPKREEMSGDRQVERRVVAQLLGLMDGLRSRGQVIVIAATNIPNAIDPALRRPGRFDREIQVGVPDESGRREILDIHSRGMPLAPDVDLARLAGQTPGFVGADLASLCREAAMSALRRLIPNIDFENGRIPEDKLSTLVVTAEDFRSALVSVQPSALREIVIQVSHKRWQDVGGLSEAKSLLGGDRGVADPPCGPFRRRRHQSAEGHPVLWPARNRQDAAGESAGGRKRGELHRHQGPPASVHVGGRVRAGRPRDLPQGTPDRALHRVLRRNRHPHAEPGCHGRRHHRPHRGAIADGN